MKIVNYVLWAAVAMSIFYACSKEDNINGADSTRSVSVSINNNTTRAEDDPAEAVTSDYSSIYIYLTDGTKVVSSDIITTPQEVQTFKTSGKSYDNISSSITSVLIVANVKNTDPLPTTAGTLVTDIETFAFAIASQQPDGANIENTKAGGLNVTMIGKGALRDTGAETPTGLKKMEATVTISPVVARMEISNSLQVGDGVSSIRIDHVYLNYYYSDHSLEPGSFVSKATVVADYVDNLQNDTYSAAVIAGTKADAYHIFANGTTTVMPHIIFKVSGTFKNADDMEGAPFTDRYLTITKFKDDNGTIEYIAANNIYKIDLSKLTIPANVLDPTPEAGRISLAVTVEVAKWSVVNVTPEL